MIVDTAGSPTDLLEVDDDADLIEALASHGWGDGLPVVAPTPERVDAMLAGCNGHDPEEVVATLPPRFGQATRLAIAVNAVMAGCLPDHLPVLVSAVRALAHPDLNLRGVNATTHCVAPLLVVHGDVARTAGYHGGLGAFGPGSRANATTAGLDNVVAAAPDDVPDDIRFDACWSNPPIRIGKPALHGLLARWLDRLAPEGTAHLVVQRHLGADSLARWLDDQGWTTSRRGSRKGYRLLDVAARIGPPADAATGPDVTDGASADGGDRRSGEDST